MYESRGVKRQKLRDYSVSPVPMSLSPATATGPNLLSVPPEMIAEVLQQRPELAPTLARVGGPFTQSGLFGAPTSTGLTTLAQMRRQKATSFACTANPAECVLTWPAPNVYVNIRTGATDIRVAFEVLEDEDDPDEFYADVLPWTAQDWNAVAWNCSCLPLSFDLPIRVFEGYDVVLHFRPTFTQDRPYTVADVRQYISQYLAEPFTVEQKRYIVSEIYAAWQHFLQQRKKNPQLEWPTAPAPNSSSVVDYVRQRRRAAFESQYVAPIPATFDDAFMAWLAQSPLSEVIIGGGEQQPALARIRSATEYIQSGSVQPRWGDLINIFAVQPVQQYDRQSGQTWLKVVQLSPDVEILHE